jgi:hypothetical protein
MWAVLLGRGKRQYCNDPGRIVGEIRPNRIGPIERWNFIAHRSEELMTGSSKQDISSRPQGAIWAQNAGGVQ